MTPPEPALPHRPTAPQRPGERDGERPTVPPWLPPPPPSSAPSSPSDNGSTGKWPNLGGPHSPRPEGGTCPSSPSPALGFGAAPLERGITAESWGWHPPPSLPPMQ